MAQRLGWRKWGVLAGVAVLAVAMTPTPSGAQQDERIDLPPGYFPWSEAASNIELLDNDPRVAPFDAAPGNFGFVNSDLAFSGNRAFVGSFNGFQVYDISSPANPVNTVTKDAARSLGVRLDRGHAGIRTHLRELIAAMNVRQKSTN